MYYNLPLTERKKPSNFIKNDHLKTTDTHADILSFQIVSSITEFKITFTQGLKFSKIILQSSIPEVESCFNTQK